jgi:hypothetical protein
MELFPQQCINSFCSFLTTSQISNLLEYEQLGGLFKIFGFLRYYYEKLQKINRLCFVERIELRNT